MKKPTVAVFFGSRSAEHDVSVVTALAAIIKPLELGGKYHVVPVYITKTGEWYCDDKLKDIKLFSSGKIDAFLAKTKPVGVVFDGGMTLIKPGLRETRIAVDIAFPATHGTFGEDGTLMGVFEMASIPYVGCDVPSSAIAMDKVLSKLLAETQGIAITNFQYFSQHDYAEKGEKWLDAIEKRLKYPLFVKPPHLGSSIAITKVTDRTELANAIELALHYDDKVLVEEGVSNLVEVTVPIIGNDELTCAQPEEPIQGDEFFDFETKYMRGGKKGGGKLAGAGASSASSGAGSEASTPGEPGAKQGAQGYSHIPARLPEAMLEECRTIAQNAYRALGCGGIARVDLLIDSKTKKIYFNEVNPLPGSLYAHNWRTIGISNVQLAEKLITYATQRHEAKQKLATSFSTNFLKQF